MRGTKHANADVSCIVFGLRADACREKRADDTAFLLYSRTVRKKYVNEFYNILHKKDMNEKCNPMKRNSIAFDWTNKPICDLRDCIMLSNLVPSTNFSVARKYCTGDG